MKTTLLIVAHPHFNESVTSQHITQFLQSTSEAANGIISIRIISELYPDGKIDVTEEQKALLEAENVVLLFPFYWYNVPAILKLWMDEVLEYGFAYGKTGDKLKGKNLLLSLSTGGPEEAYQPGGRNNNYIADYLLPMKQTAFLTGMNFLEPLVSYGMVNIKGIDIDKAPVIEKAKTHALKLYEILQVL